ncbi:MAG: energy transducer TonB [Campylobacterales bacterium]|nr:energy transducer TonB [Campylobacterales bacterium]
MIEHRYVVSFFSTTLFYLLGAGFFFFFQQTFFISQQQSTAQTIHLCLHEFVSQLEPTEIKTQQTVEKPLIEKVPEPIVEHKTVLEPEPAEPEIIKSKPMKILPIHKKVQKQTSSKPSCKKTSSPKSGASVKKVTEKKGTAAKNIVAQKNAFLAKIRERINQAKSYPGIAKRRGMQGVVQVHFTISADGKVSDIVLNGPKIFYSSAKEAIQKAFPVDTSNQTFSFPLQVNLALQYRLTQN